MTNTLTDTCELFDWCTDCDDTNPGSVHQRWWRSPERNPQNGQPIWVVQGGVDIDGGGNRRPFVWVDTRDARDNEFAPMDALALAHAIAEAVGAVRS